MPNHVYYVAVPKREDSLAKTFNACHIRYAHYFNKKSNVTGHHWQGRFFSCVLDNAHLYEAVKYIENNSVRAKLVKNPKSRNCPAPKSISKKGKGSLTLIDINTFMEINNWKEYLYKNRQSSHERIKTKTLTGRPLGNDTFVMNLEEESGGRLKALPRGRPKKEP